MSIVVTNTEQSTTVLSNIGENNIQQAAVDLNLENVWVMNGIFTIDEEKKQHRNTSLLEPDEEGYYNLSPGVYEISFDHDIEIGPDEAGYIVTRSTLIRNGVICVSGVWDPSFRGRGGCAMHVNGGPMRIKKGTRVAQFVLWKVLNAQGQYDGDYGLNADGTPKQMERKYVEDK